jgi:hypothetical protein
MSLEELLLVLLLLLLPPPLLLLLLLLLLLSQLSGMLPSFNLCRPFSNKWRWDDLDMAVLF